LKLTRQGATAVLNQLAHEWQGILVRSNGIGKSMVNYSDIVKAKLLLLDHDISEKNFMSISRRF